jgi:hypothetical protein
MMAHPLSISDGFRLMRMAESWPSRLRCVFMPLKSHCMAEIAALAPNSTFFGFPA